MADIAELIVALRLQDGVSSGLGRLDGQLKGMGAGFAQINRGIGQVGSGLDRMATRVGIAAVGLGTAFVTTASSMEEAFVGVQKTVDETVDVSFEELRQSLRELSADTGTAFEELSRIGETGGALGVPIDQLENFIDVVNRLAVSTDLSADQASTALGQLRTVLGLNNEELTGLADTLVALGNAGASTESQIVDLAARFAVAGNRAGLSTEEILALSSAVASMGIEVEAGGTALSNTFNQIAVAIGTGSAEVTAFTDHLGISAGEFRRRWETDALGVFQEWLSVVSQLPAIEQAVAFEQAGITGARQQAAIGALADNYGFVADQLNVARDATGALGEESDKFFGTSAAGFRRLRENLRLAADTIGTEMLPVLNEVIGEFLTFLQDPATQRGIKAFAEDLADGMRNFVAEVKKADLGPLIDILKGAADIAKVGFDAFRALPPGVQSLALAAFGINKLTGGALTSIASGLTNIFAGGVKFFLDRGSPVNPMFVTVTNPGLGGPTAPTGPVVTSGWASALAAAFKGALGGAFVTSLGTAIGLAIAVPIFNQSVQPAKDFERQALDDILNSDDFGRIREGVEVLDAEIKRLSDLPPQAREAWRGVISILEEQRAELAARLPKLGPPLGFHPKFNLREGFSEARNVGDRPIPVMLPDTAMQPLTTAINGLKDVIQRQKDLTGASETRNVTDRTDRIFVDDVKLDASTVHDLREPTRIAAEQLRVLTAEARSADQANRTAAAFQTAELGRNRTATVERLTTLAHKYDVTNANLGASNRHLGVIASKNPVHPVTVNNSITIPVSLSATLIEQRLVTARLASVGIPTAPTLL